MFLFKKGNMMEIKIPSLLPVNIVKTTNIKSVLHSQKTNYASAHSISSSLLGVASSIYMLGIITPMLQHKYNKKGELVENNNNISKITTNPEQELNSKISEILINLEYYAYAGIYGSVRGVHRNIEKDLIRTLQTYTTLVENFDTLDTKTKNTYLYRFKHFYRYITRKEFAQVKMNIYDPEIIQTLIQASLSASNKLKRTYEEPFKIKNTKQKHITEGRKIIFETKEGQNIILECHNYNSNYIMRLYNDTISARKDTRSYLSPNCKFKENMYKSLLAHLPAGEYGKNWIKQAKT